ncbi:hypothetical protein TNCV_85721 [Trichonephila clavipes]|nr:hypothetical protein TNCV_85721 [Trichonephila clavipes]
MHLPRLNVLLLAWFEVGREGYQLGCQPCHLTEVKNFKVHLSSPRVALQCDAPHQTSKPNAFTRACDSFILSPISLPSQPFQSFIPPIWRAPIPLHHLRSGNPVRPSVFLLAASLTAQLRLIRARLWITTVVRPRANAAVIVPLRVVLSRKKERILMKMCAGMPWSPHHSKHGFSRGFLLAS